MTAAQIVAILLGVVGFIYVAISLCYFYEHKVGLGIAFLAYAVSNYGMYLAGK